MFYFWKRILCIGCILLAIVPITIFGSPPKEAAEEMEIVWFGKYGADSDTSWYMEEISRQFNVKIVTDRENLAGILASAMMTGYFLRQMEQRMQLENLADAATSPQESNGGD